MYIYMYAHVYVSCDLSLLQIVRKQRTVLLHK